MSSTPKVSASVAQRAADAKARDKLVEQTIADERARSDAKTAKLRALRLAKEAADQATAAATPAPSSKAPKTARKSRQA